MTKKLDAHIAKLQEILDGPHGKYWAHGPAVEALIAALERADKLQDSAFRHGLMRGWSYCATDDNSGFDACMAAYSPSTPQFHEATNKYMKQSKMHLRGQLTAEAELAQRDAATRTISVAQQLPEPNNEVLLYDQNDEGWVIGWRSVWRTFGQKEKEIGKWEWSFQITELNSENTNITHWAPIPDEPEMETL